MVRYSGEFKYSIVSKMMPPQNQSVGDIAKETGLSETTLYKWQRQARDKGLVVPGGEASSERWSTQEKSKSSLKPQTTRSGPVPNARQANPNSRKIFHRNHNENCAGIATTSLTNTGNRAAFYQLIEENYRESDLRWLWETQSLRIISISEGAKVSSSKGKSMSNVKKSRFITSAWVFRDFK